jgi:alkanesulfonate monooxygenase SsuD/methylene tetrahydromethanopterin reductase-like flavin-dependent oxidoreductase (luciferase family)
LSRLRVGLHLGHYQWESQGEPFGQRLARIAHTADEAGFASLWIMDHLFQLGEQYGVVHGPVEGPMLEASTTIGFLAGATRRIALGVAVHCNFLRWPGLLVKATSTLDVISGGRAYLGIGAGWYERESRGLGIAFPPTWEERFDRLEETLQVIHHMWGGRRDGFKGAYHTLVEPIDSPRPIQRPRPPLMIGGDGERRTLRLVAEYADACNIVLPSPLADVRFGVLANEHGDVDGWLGWVRGYLRRKFAVIDEHCARVGRRPDEIERTIVTYLDMEPEGMSPDQLIHVCDSLHGMGVDHVILNVPTAHRLDPLVLIGESVLPALAQE